MKDGACLQLFDLWTSDPDDTTLHTVLEGTAHLIPQIIFPGGAFCCKSRILIFKGNGDVTEYWSERSNCMKDSKISAFIPDTKCNRWAEKTDTAEPQLPSIGKLELYYSLTKEAVPPKEHVESLDDLARRLGRVLAQRWKAKDLKSELTKSRLTVRRLKESIELAKLGQWDLDLESNSLVWSEGIYRLFKMDPSEFGASYQAFLDAIHPDDREIVDKAYTNSLVTKKPYNIVHRLLYDDGSVKWVKEVCRTEFHPKTGKPLYSIGTVQDITEDRKGDDLTPYTVLTTELMPQTGRNSSLKRDVSPKQSRSPIRSLSPASSPLPPPLIESSSSSDNSQSI